MPLEPIADFRKAISNDNIAEFVAVSAAPNSATICRDYSTPVQSSTTSRREGIRTAFRPRAYGRRLPKLSCVEATSYKPSSMYTPALHLKGLNPVVPGLLAYMLHPKRVMKCDFSRITMPGKAVDQKFPLLTATARESC